MAMPSVLRSNSRLPMRFCSVRAAPAWQHRQAAMVVLALGMLGTGCGAGGYHGATDGPRPWFCHAPHWREAACAHAAILGLHGGGQDDAATIVDGQGSAGAVDDSDGTAFAEAAQWMPVSDELDLPVPPWHVRSSASGGGEHGAERDGTADAPLSGQASGSTRPEHVDMATDGAFSLATRGSLTNLVAHLRPNANARGNCEDAGGGGSMHEATVGTSLDSRDVIIDPNDKTPTAAAAALPLRRRAATAECGQGSGGDGAGQTLAGQTDSHHTCGQYTRDAPPVPVQTARGRGGQPQHEYTAGAAGAGADAGKESGGGVGGGHGGLGEGGGDGGARHDGGAGGGNGGVGGGQGHGGEGHGGWVPELETHGGWIAGVETLEGVERLETHDTATNAPGIYRIVIPNVVYGDVIVQYRCLSAAKY